MLSYRELMNINEGQADLWLSNLTNFCDCCPCDCWVIFKGILEFIR